MLDKNRNYALLFLVLAHGSSIFLRHFFNRVLPSWRLPTGIVCHGLEAATLALLFVWGWNYGRFRLSQPGPARKGRRRDEVFLSLICLAGGPALAFVGQAALLLAWNLGFHHFFGARFGESEAFLFRHRFDLWFALFLPLSAFREEFVSRQCLFGLCVRNGVPGAGLLAAFVFAAFHSFSEADFFLIVFVLGLALNRVYLKTGSLWYPVLFHLSYNMVTLYVLQDAVPWQSLGYWAAVSVWGLGVLWTLAHALRSFNGRYVKNSKPEREHASFPRVAWGATGVLALVKVSTYLVP